MRVSFSAAECLGFIRSYPSIGRYNNHFVLFENVIFALLLVSLSSVESYVI